MTNKLNALRLVKEIKSCHVRCQANYADSVNWAIKCGELLCEMKDHAGHGNFGGLVEQHFDFSHDTANVYMKLHKDLGHLSNSERARILQDAKSVRSMQRTLAGPKETHTADPLDTPDPPEHYEPRESPQMPQDEREDIEPTDEPTIVLDASERPTSAELMQEWLLANGATIRLVDRIAADIEDDDSESHRLILDHLQEASAEMMEWLGLGD